jgi:hypothetical protein
MPTVTVAEGQWSKDNTSDFEYESPPGSPLLSSGDESIVSGDLDLYEARCVY